MNTMEFDEMKIIWDSQNNETLYTINEKALHSRILAKKNQAHHITNISELLWIIVNSSAGCFILGVNFFKQSESIVMYLLSAWMFSTALYMLVSRIRRIKRTYRFDRSMRGDLDHAISVATYQVRLSQLGRWNILPIGILSTLGVWNGRESAWWVVGLAIFFVLAIYAAGWEHRIYKVRKRELVVLQSKLESEG
jgi:hypothetical protein